MLVLTRKIGETIKIGDDVEIMVVQIGTHKVRIGVTAPKDVNVDRSEVAAAKRRNGEIKK